jgi:hypothetical protein
MKFDIRAQLTRVAEDLEHLRDDWLQNPKNDAIRRGSVTLRLLLADGVLQRAWKEVGFERQPTIVAPRLERVIEKHGAVIRFASAGGATDQGMTIAGALSSTAPVPPKDSFLEAYPFKLNEFIESASFVIHGDILNRREVVKYFAHIEGGAHLRLSARVRKDEEALVRAIEKWKREIELIDRDLHLLRATVHRPSRWSVGGCATLDCRDSRTSQLTIRAS